MEVGKIFDPEEDGIIKLPHLISDGMVLQREKEVKIWGWAIADKEVSISFQGKVYTTKPTKDYTWNLTLPPLAAGGPYTMIVNCGKQTITLDDILIGDVWVCAGQSNMEITISRVRDLYEEEIFTANNPQIRQFNIPLKYDFNIRLQDVDGGEWKSANPENILDFSAVAYFYARTLYEKYNIPIGIIKSSVGGSPIEAWLSENALHGFPDLLKTLEKYQDDIYVKDIIDSEEIVEKYWYQLLDDDDKGLSNEGQSWYEPSLDDSEWSCLRIPVDFKDIGLEDFNGVIWLRKELDLPPSVHDRPAKLYLGRIIDSDIAYINGKAVGRTEYQYPPRKYIIPDKLLKEGKNTIVLRIICNDGQGGIVEDKPYEIVVEDQIIDLKGEWKYKVGATCKPLPEKTFVQWKPVGLYNGMITPLFNYVIKGLVWYQGESNVSRAEEYKEFLVRLIYSWRKKWGDMKLPFLYVQLPNYGRPAAYSAGSEWARLREAQLEVLSKVANTAMVVTIDIGEWNDLHPFNKKDVGIRLALAAEFIAYGEKDIVHSGPIFESMEIKVNKCVLSFDNIGGGLVKKGSGDLQTFFITDNDKDFYQAEAEIIKDQVVVWNDDIENPAAVCYAWADNPEGANLYNKEGLPASPFRTD